MYRIGPSDVFLPSDLRADADTLNAQVARVDGAVGGNENVSPDFTDGWTSFAQRWRAFYDGHWSGWLSSVSSALNDSNRDQLIAFETEFTAWAARAAREGAGISDPIYAPSTGAGDTLGAQAKAQFAGFPLPDVSTIGIIAAIVVAAYFVLKAKA